MALDQHALLDLLKELQLTETTTHRVATGNRRAAGPPRPARSLPDGRRSLQSRGRQRRRRPPRDSALSLPPTDRQVIAGTQEGHDAGCSTGPSPLRGGAWLNGRAPSGSAEEDCPDTLARMVTVVRAPGSVGGI